MTQLLRELPEGLSEVEGITAAVIPDLGALEPFLISLVSDSDHWCFISTSGALTAGRRDADTALLPYETDDRLHEAAGITGPVTSVMVDGPDGPVVWEPFGRCPDPRARRAAAKSELGDVVWLEEIHPELPLAFRVRWATSEAFGVVRRVQLIATGGTPPVEATVVDGLLGVVPHGVTARMQQTLRNLVTAYRRSELVDAPVPLVVHALESQVVDQAVPAESLRATVTWSLSANRDVVADGDSADDVAVDRAVLRAARRGADPFSAPMGKSLSGQPAAHLQRMRVIVRPGSPATWYVVGDVGLDQVAVADLRARLGATDDLPAAIEASVREGSAALSTILASADGTQVTADPVASAHHLSNTLFNCMRGGVFADEGWVDTSDLRRFVGQRNRRVVQQHAGWFDGLPDVLSRPEVLRRAAAVGEPHLHRLVLEHLPILFSRRHGDPSRPWNQFSIRLRDKDGNPVRSYEGNWRDIFQNWEALCESFPAFLPGVIATFVNASTADGFNPYRITREGIDWEVPDPEDPWSNIGYWGDHQIVYLLRLLDAAGRWDPDGLTGLLDRRLFTFADVPYQLASYEEILADPHDTIAFDAEGDARARARVAALGGDGLLLPGPDGQPQRVTLLEKLLIPALAKLSAFVPDGGIWMHTQRPEWNDANNALVGNGLSMVTLFQLRRYLTRLAELAGAGPDGEDRPGAVMLSSSVARWLAAVTASLRAHPELNARAAGSGERAALMRRLGEAFEAHRTALATDGPGDAEPVPAVSIKDLVEVALPLLDGTIARARRDDGLYHSYNLLRLDDGGAAAGVEHLQEMLEGQVAVLGSGVLDHGACADLLDAVHHSELHRHDLGTYLLYPDRRPPPFMDKNVVPEALVRADPLLRTLCESGHRGVVARDADGVVRFAGALANASELDQRLDELAADTAWAPLVAAHRGSVLEAWETVFHHHAFTGRSGGMYGYEGLGSVYWHMVGKLLVAVQELTLEAHFDGAAPGLVDRLRGAYRRVRSGLGFTKPASVFGAFPTDAYSHTPSHAGAQQPGMTGYVKELILTRRGELGLWVRDGCLVVDALLLDDDERLAVPVDWDVEAMGGPTTIPLAPGELGATLCQVPVVVGPASPNPSIELTMGDGSTAMIDGTTLPRDLTAAIAGRTGAVRRLRVIPAARSRSDAGAGPPARVTESAGWGLTDPG